MLNRRDFNITAALLPATPLLPKVKAFKEVASVTLYLNADEVRWNYFMCSNQTVYKMPGINPHSKYCNQGIYHSNGKIWWLYSVNKEFEKEYENSKHRVKIRNSKYLEDVLFITNQDVTQPFEWVNAKDAHMPWSVRYPDDVNEKITCISMFDFAEMKKVLHDHV